MDGWAGAGTRSHRFVIVAWDGWLITYAGMYVCISVVGLGWREGAGC